MEIQSSGEFSKGVRAALESERLLAACKGMLDDINAFLQQEACGSNVWHLKRFLSDAPAVAEAQALIRSIEGRARPAHAILAWPIRGWLRGFTPEEYDALEATGILEFQDLRVCTPHDLLIIDEIGPHEVSTIKWTLNEIGLRWPAAVAPPPGHAIYDLHYSWVIWDLSRHTKRSTDALYRHFDRLHIDSVEDLVQWTPRELCRAGIMNHRIVECLERNLGLFGLALANEDAGEQEEDEEEAAAA